MRECEIPINISSRKMELSNFSERFERIMLEFKDLKQDDEAFKSGSDKQI